MGAFMGLFFSEKDAFIIEEIAKIHNVDVDIVKPHYKAMLEGVSNEVQHKA